jgi:hypothetical protein
MALAVPMPEENASATLVPTAGLVPIYFFPCGRLHMRNGRGTLFWAVPLLGLGLMVGLLTAGRPAPGPAADHTTVGRYRIHDAPVGKFVYRLLFDSTTGDFWVWSNGEWERPDPPRGGFPWKGVKGEAGRFQLVPQLAGDLDAEMYVMDTVTGKMWARSVRNRAVLLQGEPWRDIPVPPPPRR